MPTEIRMKEWTVNSDVTEAAVSNWFKKPGSPVKKGDLLVELLVEKANVEVEAPSDGILLEIRAAVGQAVSPGDVLATLGSLEEWEALTTAPVAQPRAAAPASREKAPAAEAEPGREVPLSPLAKRLMREEGISQAELLAFVGPGQVRRIGEEEVRRFIAARAESASTRSIPYSGLRRMIGERMSNSLRQLAQLTITSETDVTQLVNQREKRKEGGDALSYTALIARAVLLCLPNHPYLNAALEAENIRLFSQVNLGIAIDAPQGLVVPVIKDAGKLSVAELTAEIQRLSNLAREGKLSPEDNAGGTFSISNLGNYEIDMFTPVINPPQCAILGIGRIVQKPAVIEGQVVPRHLMWLSLSFDHRILDGGPASSFLKDVRGCLEQPAALFS